MTIRTFFSKFKGRTRPWWLASRRSPLSFTASSPPALCDKFRRHFKEIVFSVHPYGVEGEIPGMQEFSHLVKQIFTKYCLKQKFRILLAYGLRPRFLAFISFFKEIVVSFE